MHGDGRMRVARIQYGWLLRLARTEYGVSGRIRALRAKTDVLLLAQWNCTMPQIPMMLQNFLTILSALMLIGEAG